MERSKLSDYTVKLSVLGITAIVSLGAVPNEAIAQPSATPLPASTPSNTSTALPNLIGEWQLEDILPVGIKAVFTTDNKLYIFVPSSIPFVDFFTPEPIVLDFRYKLNTATAPYQLDISSPSGGDSLLTIFEVPESDKMRVEFFGLKPGEPRPNSFTVGAVVLEKISTTTALPRNVKLIDLQLDNLRSSESNARSAMSSINSSQIYYYSTRKKFASSISELGAYLSANKNYEYKIAPHPTQKSAAIATAAAKISNVKSFTAVVAEVKIKGKNTVLSGTCETEEPSKTPPAPPKIDIKGQLICAPGSVKPK